MKIFSGIDWLLISGNGGVVAEYSWCVEQRNGAPAVIGASQLEESISSWRWLFPMLLLWR